MTNEEILRAARKDSEKDGGEYEGRVKTASMELGFIWGLVMLALITIFEAVIEKRFDYGKSAMILVIRGVQNWYYGYRIKNKKKLIIGLIEIVAAIIEFGLCIGAMFS